MTVTAAPPEEKTAAAPKKSKKKLIIIAVVVLLLGGGAGYWFVLKPSPEPGPPEPGPVFPLEPIQINLAQGHYLRLGLSLQLTLAASEGGGHGGEFDGSKALDAAIEVFSGRDVAELAKEGQRAKLKKELMHLLEERYHGDVMDVYFTEFVTE